VEGIAKTSPEGIAGEVFDTHLLQLLGMVIAPRFAFVGERLFDVFIDVVSFVMVMFFCRQSPFLHSSE